MRPRAHNVLTPSVHHRRCCQVFSFRREHAAAAAAVVRTYLYASALLGRARPGCIELHYALKCTAVCMRTWWRRSTSRGIHGLTCMSCCAVDAHSDCASGQSHNGGHATPHSLADVSPDILKRQSACGDALPHAGDMPLARALSGAMHGLAQAACTIAEATSGLLLGLAAPMPASPSIALQNLPCLRLVRECSLELLRQSLNAKPAQAELQDILDALATDDEPPAPGTPPRDDSAADSWQPEAADIMAWVRPCLHSTELSMCCMSDGQLSSHQQQSRALPNVAAPLRSFFGHPH